MPRVLSATKHFQVTLQLRKELQKLKPGDFVPTVTELRNSLDASHGTIIKALTSLNEEGVVYRTAGKQRYQVSQFSERPLGRVVIIRPEYPSSDLDSLIHAIISAGKLHKWAFSLQTFSSLEYLDLHQAGHHQDVIVLLPSTEEFPPHLVKALHKPRRPVLLIQQHTDLPTLSNICIDDEAVGRLAVEHLAAMGHRRVLIVLDQSLDSTIMHRLKGWKETLLKNGVTDWENLVLDCEVKPFENAAVKAYQTFSAFIREHPAPDFTAIFCTSNPGSMAVLRSLRENKIRVPEDISVIGYDGESGSGQFLYPPLTSIEIQMEKFGEETVQLLLKLIRHTQTPPQHIRITPALITRETTASCKAEPTGNANKDCGK